MQNASKSVQISGLTNKGKYTFCWSPYKYTSTNFVWGGCLKGDEFNGDALSNVVASFFHNFVIVLLVECEKSWQPRLTDCRR